MFYIRKDSMMKKQSFTYSRKPKFGMRKLSIGLASCMLGMMFLTTGHTSAADDTGHVGEDITVVPEQQELYGGYNQRLKDIEDFYAERQADHVRYTKWLDGVNVSENEFRKVVDGEAVYWAAPLKNDRGYYDINKDFNQDSDKCSAAVAANMFHYWLDKNKDNIARFMQQKPGEHGVIKLQDTTINLSDFLNTYESDTGYRDKSKLFDFISNNFSGPVWTDKLLDAYINGYGYNHKWERNTEDSKRNTSKINFFKEVFNAKLLTNVYSIENQNEFSDFLREALYTGKAVGLSYGPVGLRAALGHIISVWGADLDEKGNVVAVYVTDSDDKKITIGEEKERIGLKRYKVSTDEQGRVRLTAYGTTQNTGGQLRRIYTLDTGKYIWADYFNNPEKAK